jgi:hypothetical protein
MSRHRRIRGRHAWKGSCRRNMYAVLWAPRLRDWVRVVYFGPDDYVMVDLDNRLLT